MSFALKRLIRKSQRRSFHTPFALLGNSHLASTPSSPSIATHYEKHYDHPSVPITSHTGYRTYVVSEPDPSTKHYQVPAGAYPISAPYTNFIAMDAPKTKNTSPAGRYHGFTTRSFTSTRT